MSRPSGETEDDSYEAVLVREDRRGLRGWLIGVIVFGLALSTFFDVWRTFWVLIPLMVFNVLGQAWNAHRTIRMGYVVRGKAMIPGVWWTSAVTLFLAAALWLQARYGLWFSQYAA